MRRRETVIRALTHYPPSPNDRSPEDIWYHEFLFVSTTTLSCSCSCSSCHLWFVEWSIIQAEAVTLPHADISQRFSIETIFADNTLAFHRVCISCWCRVLFQQQINDEQFNHFKTWNYVHSNWNEFLPNYCPEGLALWPSHTPSDNIYDQEAWSEGEGLLNWT